MFAVAPTDTCIDTAADKLGWTCTEVWAFVFGFDLDETRRIQDEQAWLLGKEIREEWDRR